jgi:hypothetical protein
MSIQAQRLLSQGRVTETLARLRQKLVVLQSGVSEAIGALKPVGGMSAPEVLDMVADKAQVLLEEAIRVNVEATGLQREAEILGVLKEAEANDGLGG